MYLTYPAVSSKRTGGHHSDPLVGNLTPFHVAAIKYDDCNEYHIYFSVFHNSKSKAASVLNNC